MNFTKKKQSIIDLFDSRKNSQNEVENQIQGFLGNKNNKNLNFP